MTWAEHGEPFVAAVENGPLSATQFHPEKSGDAGAALLAQLGAVRCEPPMSRERARRREERERLAAARAGRPRAPRDERLPAAAHAPRAARPAAAPYPLAWSAGPARPPAPYARTA